MDIKTIQLKLPECIKDETITPMTKEEARAYLDKLYLNCPDFNLLPLPAFYLEENEHIAKDKNLKSHQLQYMRETEAFYETIQDLPEEERIEKIKERNMKLGIRRKPEKLPKKSGNLLMR